MRLRCDLLKESVVPERKSGRRGAGTPGKSTWESQQSLRVLSGRAELL